MATATLASLRSLRNRHDAAALREQRALLRALDRLPLRRWREVEALHEDLLFLWAFAGSAGIAREARARLASIGSRLRALPKRERGLGDDTGIAGSVTRHVYPFPIARWLARTEDLAIDWGGVRDETALDNVVRVNLAWTRSDVEWLTNEPRVADAWDQAEGTVTWPLADSRLAVTHNALRFVRRVERRAVRQPGDDVATRIGTPMQKCRGVAIAERQREVAYRCHLRGVRVEMHGVERRT